MEKILEKLRQKENLTFEESKSSFELLMTVKASEDEIYNFLTLLSEKGEVSDEIAGGVYVLREKSKRVNVDDCIDTCGTGGDGMKARKLKRWPMIWNSNKSRRRFYESSEVPVHARHRWMNQEKVSGANLLVCVNFLGRPRGLSHQLHYLHTHFPFCATAD